MENMKVKSVTSSRDGPMDPLDKLEDRNYVEMPKILVRYFRQLIDNGFSEAQAFDLVQHVQQEWLSSQFPKRDQNMPTGNFTTYNILSDDTERIPYLNKVQK